MRGVAVAGGFRRCRCLIPLQVAGLAASRRVGFAPALLNDEGSNVDKLSGLYRAASVLAVYASQSASPRPTQDSLAASGQLLLHGIGYPQGSE